ncbi:prolyl endopeptidase-like isoform X2 [Pseudophryne corroboree]|uniref:prolyl endopeptidase-like isoform X2 n=1 Tax=Pseudophryne corroboree TaxID=495146 RepID=UPI0030818D0F
MKVKFFVQAISRLVGQDISALKTARRMLCAFSWRYDLTHGNTDSPKNRLVRGMCSWQSFLDAERRHWQTSSVFYKDLAAVLNKCLYEIHNSYPIRREREMISRGDYMYFAEDNCIYRLRKSIGETSQEVLFCPEDVGLQDHLIQRIRVSLGQSFLAIALKGYEREESVCIVVKSEDVAEIVCSIPNVFSFEWVTDRVLFHTKQENLQCHCVYATDFSNPSDTKLVYTEQDDSFFVDIYCTRDGRFLTINSNSKTTSEVWLIDCSYPFKPPTLVHPRMPGIVYHVEHSNGYLYILTTYGDTAEYKLVKAPLNSGIQHWKPIYQMQAESRLLDMEMLKDHCAVFLRHHNELYMDVTSLSSESVIHSLKFPEWACALQPALRPEENTNHLRLYLESPIHQPVMFDYSVLANRLSEVTDHSSEENETCRVVRMKAKSKDGTLVPVTVLYEVGGGLRHRPLLVHVYGAYGMDLNMSFKAEKRMLVEDGWILAYCHVRGGGELGCEWHKQGILDKKRNGLDDLQACITYIHDLGFSQPYRTALEAASAGGVLAGALYNSTPWLFQAMILEAPFMDVLNTMLDTLLPLTVEEQEEWGNPLLNMQHYRSIEAYCPYENIKPQNYPSVLITAYENDQRVPLHGLLRYVKKLRTAAVHYFQSSTLPDRKMPNILLDVRPGGSHCDSLSWEDSLQKVELVCFPGLNTVLLCSTLYPLLYPVSSCAVYPRKFQKESIRQVLMLETQGKNSTE